MAAQPTDQQLAAMIRHLARLHLEVERGLRPPDQLRPYMTPASYRRLRGQQGVRFDDPSTPTREDLGPVHLSRLSPDKVLASLRTREQGDQHGALVVELEATQEGRWRITELARVGHQLALHGPVSPPVADERTRIRRTEDERSAVEAAHRAESKRMGELSGQEAGRAESFAAFWEQRLVELDQELRVLRHQGEVREAHALQREQPPPDVNDVVGRHEPETPDDAPHPQTSRGQGRQPMADEPSPPPPTDLELSGGEAVVRLLGPEPGAGRPRRVWQRACDEIRDYRARWEITDDELLLGPLPDHHDQSRDRARVADVVRTARQELAFDDRASLARESPSLDLAR